MGFECYFLTFQVHRAMVNNNNNNNNNKLCTKLLKLQIRPPSLILLITTPQDRWIFSSQSWEVINSIIIIIIIIMWFECYLLTFQVHRAMANNNNNNNNKYYIYLSDSETGVLRNSYTNMSPYSLLWLWLIQCFFFLFLHSFVCSSYKCITKSTLARFFTAKQKFAFLNCFVIKQKQAMKSNLEHENLP